MIPRRRRAKGCVTSDYPTTDSWIALIACYAYLQYTKLSASLRSPCLFLACIIIDMIDKTIQASVAIRLIFYMYVSLIGTICTLNLWPSMGRKPTQNGTQIKLVISCFLFPWSIRITLRSVRECWLNLYPATTSVHVHRQESLEAAVSNMHNY